MDLTENRGRHVIGAVMACSVLAGLALAGRVAARKLSRTGFVASDYLVAMGLLGAWLLAGLIVWGVKLGLGKHVQAVPMGNLETILKTDYAQEICYSISLPLIKISILLFYRSIFLGRMFDIYTYATGAFVVGWGVAVLFVAIFSCRPVSGFWDIRMEPAPVCINNRDFFIANSSLNIFADVIILCLPMGKVWSLQMARKSKAAVSGMFLMGGFVIVASCLRFQALLGFNEMGFNERDFTWNEIETVLWGCIEVSVAVVSACLPTMGPVLQAVLQSPFLLKILGTRGKMGAKDPWRKPAGIERNEAFHRLPEHSNERLSDQKAQRRFESPILLEDMECGGCIRESVKDKSFLAGQERDV